MGRQRQSTESKPMSHLVYDGTRKSAASGSALLRTKLSLPAARKDLIGRPQLIQRLGTCLSGPLTLLSAPAGYGKTTVVSQWRATEEGARSFMGWLSLDAADNDPTVFFRYFIGALQDAGLTVDPSVEQSLSAPSTLSVSDVMAALINSLVVSDHDCVLFLDDYQTVENLEIHDALALLLEHQPPMLHLVILSRSMPPFLKPSLRMRRSLTMIGEPELRFTTEEVGRLFREIAHVELGDDEIAALEEKTEGWAAALQLVALSRRDRPDADPLGEWLDGETRPILEYLLTEVFERQSGAVRRFLEATAVLDRMCGPLCDELLTVAMAEWNPDAGPMISGSEMIEYLRQANLFIVPVGQTAHWVRYHRMFRDLLVERLTREHPSTKPILHKAASAWFTRQGLDAEAVTHALLSEDWLYAADIIEGCGMRTLHNGDLRSLLAWTAALPREVVFDRPALCVLQALAHMVRYRHEDLAAVQESLNAAVQQGQMGLAENAGGYEGYAAAAECYLAMRPNRELDPRAKLLWARKALELPAADDVAFSAGLLALAHIQVALGDIESARISYEACERAAMSNENHYCAVESVFHRIRLQHETGQLRVAEHSCQHAKSYYEGVFAQRGIDVPGLGGLDIALACIHIEQNRLREAESELTAGLERVWKCAPAHFEVVGLEALSHLRTLQQRDDQALAAIDEIEDMWPASPFHQDALRMRHLIQRASGSARTRSILSSWCEEFSPDLGDRLHLVWAGPIGGAEWYFRSYLIWARAQTLIGRPEVALAWLEAETELMQQEGLGNRVVALMVERALALHAMGRTKSATDVLCRALLMAQPQDYVRVFDMGDATLDMLARAASRRDVREYAERLAECLVGGPHMTPADEDSGGAFAAGMQQQDGQPPDLLPVHLTSKELRVLEAVARGLSNAEIAQMCFVEVGTVKQHINHIMRKLGVTNRTAAVSEGRRRSLLS